VVERRRQLCGEADDHSEKKIPIESTCATPLRDRFGIQARLEPSSSQGLKTARRRRYAPTGGNHDINAPACVPPPHLYPAGSSILATGGASPPTRFRAKW
jgi:hypothetical protein